MMKEVTAIVLLLGVLANCDFTWAQYALDVDLLLYDTDWNTRFPCPGSCDVRYQYCLKTIGSPPQVDCIMTIREYPTIISAEMADNFDFNLTETFSLTNASTVITSGQVQFYLEAALLIDIPSLGTQVFVQETFSLDVDNLEVNNSYTDVLSQSGATPSGIEVNPPGILNVQLRARCEENLYGPDCSVSCTPRDDIFGHYTCGVRGNIVCLTGYCDAAIDCAEECDECAASPCLNGGSCTDLFGDFNCSCLPTHSGEMCEEALEFTSDAPDLVSTSNGLTTTVITDATSVTMFSPLTIGLIAGSAGVCCVVIFLVVVFGIVIIRVRRKLLRAKAQAAGTPIKTSDDLIISINPSYDRDEEHNRDRDRDSYISMHSQHLYESISDVVKNDAEEINTRDESISDIDTEKNDAEANNEINITVSRCESNTDIDTEKNNTEVNEMHTTVHRETVEESISDIDTKKNDTEITTVSRETAV